MANDILDETFTCNNCCVTVHRKDYIFRENYHYQELNIYHKLKRIRLCENCAKNDIQGVDI